MGSGASRAHREELKKELEAKENAIRELQERLDAIQQQQEQEQQQKSSSQPKPSRSFATSMKRNVVSPASPTSETSDHATSRPMEGITEADSTSSSVNHNNERAVAPHGRAQRISAVGAALVTPVPASSNNVPASSNNNERILSGGTKAVKRRTEVSAEVISNKKILAAPQQRAFYPKSDATKEMLMRIIQSNVLFTGQTSDEINDCLDAFFPLKATNGTYVIKQGDQGDHFYAIEKGQCEVLVSVNGSALLRYGSLSAGQGFGELALLCNTPRAATIRAVGEVELWALERNTFREILASHKMRRIQKALEYLKQVTILNKLTHSELQQVAAAMEWEEYDSGSVLIRQGEVGEHFYLLTQGDILVTQMDAQCDEEVQIRTMKSGDHFGEMALLKEEVRSATCTAITHVQCLTLGREHFIAMLGSLQELMDREPAHPEPRISTNMSPQKLIAMQSGQHLIENKTAQQKSASDALVQNYKYMKDIQREELEVLQTLGRGAFGRVKLVRHTSTNSAFALKCLVKSHIVDNNLKEHVINEKNVMLLLDHPFVLKLFNTYQDSKYLYLLVELIQGGELFTFLRKRQRFDESMARFYIASVVLVFQQMHSKSIAYRDLKPENILLDNAGFIKVVDFGLAKIVTSKTWTLCGTPDYLAPEIILNKGHDRAVDYWALGILIYELIAGVAPFYASEPMQIYALVIQGDMRFPNFFSRSSVDLIQRLLTQNPARRLGNMKNGIQDIINHKWFAGFNWDRLLRRTMPTPIVPQVKDAFDTSNFDDFNQDIEDVVSDCEWDPSF